MATETQELTQVQTVLDGLSSPTDEQFVQAVRAYSDGAVASAAAKRGLGGGGGGSLEWEDVGTTVASGGLPDWWTVGADESFTMQPTDQTTDSPFLNMLCDYSQLVDESNLGYVMNVRPVGSAPGDGDELFSVSVINTIFRSAPGEGSAIFRVKSSDFPTANSLFGIGSDGAAFFSLLPEGGDGTLDKVMLQTEVGIDTEFRIPHLPTSDPGLAGHVWNDAGTLKVSL